MESPTIQCVPSKDGTTWSFHCPYCKKKHTHGAGEGHRAAHCTEESSPYNKTGYNLVLGIVRASDVERRKPIDGYYRVTRETHNDINKNDPECPEERRSLNWWWDKDARCICVNDRRQFYYVESDHLKSPKAMVRMLAHMEEKTWMTNKALGELVRHMLDRATFNPHG